jgi:hypothetical protein
VPRGDEVAEALSAMEIPPLLSWQLPELVISGADG